MSLYLIKCTPKILAVNACHGVAQNRKTRVFTKKGAGFGTVLGVLEF